MLTCASLNKLASMYPTTAPSLSAETTATSTTLAPSVGATSETQSEISSQDSDFSDIRIIAVKLGVANPDDLHTERFKIDRQKLEQLITATSAIEGLNGAEYFFDNIMKVTGTYISWPCRLKVGAKSKRDPHVRIVGKVEQVQLAKERVLASLDSRGSRVIMKMDVSYTDHSYIIGRGGNNIKRIMEDTQTHIHFPDSNRSNAMEKSNQVSLCGTMEGVERARALVRSSTPLLMSFELPIMGPGRLQPDSDTPYVQMIEKKYNVQVIFSSRPKLHSSLILIKGSENEANQVKEATQTLINLSCDKIAHQITVTIQMEISPQHHEIVKGKHNTNLLSIMERTKTKIIFADLSDYNIKQLKKSQVTIAGTIDGVYKARQQLLGNLPITLILDLPENQDDIAEIIGLSSKYGVYISLRQKQRQSTLAVVIKGVEKYIDQIYEARQEILHLNTKVCKGEIPETYFAPKDKEIFMSLRTTLTSLLSGYPDSPKTPNLASNVHMQFSPYIQKQQQQQHNNNNKIANFITNNNNNKHNCNQNNNQQQQQLFEQYTNSAIVTPTICVPTQKYLQMHNSNFSRQQPNHNNNYLQVSPAAAVGGGGVVAATQLAAMQQQQQQQPQTAVLSPRNSCSHNTSGYQSFSSSTNSLEQSYPPYSNSAANAQQASAAMRASNGESGSLSNARTHYSPDSTFGNEVGCARMGRRSSDGVLLGLGASGPMAGVGGMAPGSAESYRNLNYDIKRNFDFDMKRAMGFKAMERPPISGELRVPNANWMGLALSRTSPTPTTTLDAGGGGDEQSWRHGVGAPAVNNSPYMMGATTGIVDSTPTNRRLQLAQYKDIQALFTSLGLEHYIKLFVMNEIDLEMFATLTEENIMELGVTAFGARKKMLLAINALQANEATNSGMPSNAFSPRFSGSAAPGAERRPSNQW